MLADLHRFLSPFEFQSETGSISNRLFITSILGILRETRFYGTLNPGLRLLIFRYFLIVSGFVVARR